MKEAQTLVGEIRRVLGCKPTFFIGTCDGVRAWCRSIATLRWQQQQQQQVVVEAEGTETAEQKNSSSGVRVAEGQSAGRDSEQLLLDGVEGVVQTQQRQGLGQKLTDLERAIQSQDIET